MKKRGEKASKNLAIKTSSINELAELTRQVRVLEFKIITSFIQNRNNKIEETIAIEGYAFDFLPLVSAQLIKEKDEIIVEFNNLYDSDLATLHRDNFISQVNRSIARIISSPLLEHYRNLVEEPIKVPTGPPIPTMEEFIKSNYQPFDFEGIIKRNVYANIARWSAINIWGDYEHYMNEVLHHCKTKVEEPENNRANNKNLPFIKIKWKGQKNQLYDVLRQLKEGEGKILNSYTELAVFLKTNFDTFENTSLSTIETELQRGKRPTKNRRINIDNK